LIDGRSSVPAHTSARRVVSLCAALGGVGDTSAFFGVGLVISCRVPGGWSVPRPNAAGAKTVYSSVGGKRLNHPPARTLSALFPAVGVVSEPIGLRRLPPPKCRRGLPELLKHVTSGRHAYFRGARARPPGCSRWMKMRFRERIRALLQISEEKAIVGLDERDSASARFSISVTRSGTRFEAVTGFGRCCMGEASAAACAWPAIVVPAGTDRLRRLDASRRRCKRATPAARIEGLSRPAHSNDARRQEDHAGRNPLQSLL